MNEKFSRKKEETMKLKKEEISKKIVHSNNMYI